MKKGDGASLSGDVTGMLPILILYSAATLGFFIFGTMGIRGVKLFPLRALFKRVTHGDYAREEKQVRLWIAALLILGMTPWFWILRFAWGTDWSFMIGLYPLLWYYFLLRYIVWEKDDLAS